MANQIIISFIHPNPMSEGLGHEIPRHNYQNYMYLVPVYYNLIITYLADKTYFY